MKLWFLYADFDKITFKHEFMLFLYTFTVILSIYKRILAKTLFFSNIPLVSPPGVYKIILFYKFSFSEVKNDALQSYRFFT